MALALIDQVRFAADSSLEGTGFELSVPREIGLGCEALSFICRHKSWRSAEGTHSARGTSTATIGRASQEGGLRVRAVPRPPRHCLTIPPAVLAMAD